MADQPTLRLRRVVRAIDRARGCVADAVASRESASDSLNAALRELRAAERDILAASMGGDDRARAHAAVAQHMADRYAPEKGRRLPITIH